MIGQNYCFVTYKEQIATFKIATLWIEIYKVVERAKNFGIWI
ncbi:hypothetical protein SAMN05660841_03552 [Sphingobacterium nematocida]|uniref:Uncharacterized protein n=1 Tax=Sphingobacterium nematocida TaxID=1513896 RepID=A0A1T5FVG1_9SPHI|nr:hypothetical protein SAMN05660841_03552 [Sphingobacterium nematocida]